MERERTPSAERGDIQAGRTGDKTPGFDPAMAPMETDAEAGGVATEGGIEPLPTSPPRHTNQTSYASAMRRPPDLPRPANTGRPRSRLILAAMIVAALLLILLVMVGPD